MNRRDVIKSAVALALYGPRFPAQAHILSRTSSNSLSAQTQATQGIPFPRVAVIGIGGDQSYGWDNNGTYLGQVGSNAISSNGYFSGASYVNPIQWLGRFDLAIIGGVWEGWTSSGGRDRADLVEAIKQVCYPIGASAKVFSYNIMEETASPPAPLGSSQNQNGTADPTSYLSNEIANQQWYLYSDTQGDPAQGSDGTAYAETNWAVAWPNAVGGTSADTSFAPKRVTAPDGTSEGPTDWAADYFVSLSLTRSTGYTGSASGTISPASFIDSRWSWPYETDAPNQDGLFIDNLFAAPYVGGYYDLQNYCAGNSTAFNTPVCAWLMRGTQHFFARFQTEVQKAYPGRTYYNFGNLASWQYAYVSGYWGTVSNGIQNTMHGGLLEGSIGASWSIEQNSGWYADINSLQGIVDFCLDPKLVVHATRGSGTKSTNYQLMRYGLTTALMGQAYHTCDQDSGYDYSTAIWYDEYGGNPGTNVPKGYLGNPKGSRPTAAAIGPVWVADFDNGVALCFPRTDLSNNPYPSPVTVTADQINSYLGTNYSFSFIKGVQNPALNSGQAMTSVTLQPGGDGVILLHGTASATTAAIVAYDWSGTSGDNIASQSVTRNVAINKGDLLVAWVMGYGSNYPSTVVDGQLGTLLTAGAAEAETSYPSFLKTYWTIATQDYTADASNQVTASFSPVASHINVIWALYRCSSGYVFGTELASVGAAQNSPGTAAGAISTGSVNVGSAPAFLIAGTEILGLGGPTPTVYSAGWTQDFADGTDNFSEATIFVNAQGTQECQWTAASNSGGADYGSVLAAFSVVSSTNQTVTTVSHNWSGTSGNNITSQSVARNVAISKGDLLVAWVMGYGASYPSSVADGQLGTLETAGSAQAATTYPSFLKAYWTIATQDYAADPSNQVTATFSPSASEINVIWALYRCSTGYVFGAQIASAGAAQNSPGTGAGAINTGSATISSSPAFLVAGTEILGLGQALPTVSSSGWTQDFADGTDNFAEASTVVSAQGSQECQWTAGSNSGGADYGNVLAGFSIVSAG